MRSFLAGLQRLLSELRRRKVYQVAALYCVGAFALLQVADIVLPALGASDGALVVVMVLMVAGFPAALLLGWMYDWTDSGMRRTRDAAGPAEGPSRGVRTLAVIAAAAATILVSMGGWKVLELRQPAPAIAESATELPDLDPRRVAVLYFDDHSPDGSLGYLAAGITESLLHELAAVPGLAVSSRNAVRTFRESPVPFDSMVASLGVGSIVEGSVTSAGGEVRATVQLIDGRTGSHVDSRIVDGTVERLFAFQDSVAVTVARSLRNRLGQEIRLRGDREGARSPEAWVLYQRAQELVRTMRRFERDEGEGAVAAYLRADSLLGEAQRLDPDWSGPAVRRIDIAYRIAVLGGPAPGALDTAWAGRAIRRAEALLQERPEEAGALHYRGLINLRLATTPGAGLAESLLAAAEADLGRATRLNPDDPESWWVLSEVMIQRARFEEAVEAAQRALDTDTFLEIESSALHALFYATLQLGPRDEAVRWCDEGRRRFPREINFLRCRMLVLGTFPQVEPDVAEASALLDSIVRLASPRTAPTWRMFAGSHLAQTLARAGLPDSAVATLARVRGDSTPAMLGSHEAKVHLLLGDHEEATRLLRHYLTFDPDTAFLAVDWWFLDLHDYPAFRELVGLDGPGRATGPPVR